MSFTWETVGENLVPEIFVRYSEKSLNENSLSDRASNVFAKFPGQKCIFPLVNLAETLRKILNFIMEKIQPRKFTKFFKQVHGKSRQHWNKFFPENQSNIP